MASCLPNETIQEIVLVLYEAYSKPFNIIYHSCMLLNKKWCVNTMAVIWRKVLDDYNGYDKRIIDAYIIELSQDSKDLIGISKEEGTNYYNYASFLREIDLLNLYDVLAKYVAYLNNDSGNIKLLEEQDFYTIQILYHELLKLFIKESENLSYKIIFRDHHSLRLNPFKNCPFYNNLSKIIPTNSHLTSLQCFVYLDPEVLLEFSKIFSSVDHLQFFGELNHKDLDNAGLVTLMESINTIKKLELFMGYSSKITEHKVVEAISKKVDSLVKLCVGGEKSSAENVMKIFTERLALKNLKEFEYSGCLKASCFDMLLQNANGNIKKLTIHDCYLKDEEGKKCFLVFDSICNYCPRLTSLYICIDKERIEYIFNILEACQNLQKLALFETTGTNFSIDDWMLRFPVLSPPSLKFFKFGRGLKFNMVNLEKFFQGCYDKSIKDMYFFVMDSELSEAKELVEKYIELGTLNWKSRRCYLGDEFLYQNRHLYTVNFTTSDV